MANDQHESIASTTSAGLITDPFLVEILQTSNNARSACLAVLSLLSSSPLSLPSNSNSTQAPPTPPQIQTATSQSSPSLVDAQKGLHTYLSTLRGQNRRLAHLVRTNKAMTATSRAEIDALHLSLQNLHYESRHLAGEIAACERFPHTYTSLPLIPEEEFLDRFPEWRRRRRGRRRRGDADDDNTSDSENTSEEDDDDDDDADEEEEEQLMKARIQAEYEDRVALEEERKKLVARKVELVRQNAKRKDELGKLDQDLEKFVQAASPILKTFEKEY